MKTVDGITPISELMHNLAQLDDYLLGLKVETGEWYTAMAMKRTMLDEIYRYRMLPNPINNLWKNRAMSYKIDKDV